jgi:NADP-dependent aldehyde dehydrogenase
MSTDAMLASDQLNKVLDEAAATTADWAGLEPRQRSGRLRAAAVALDAEAADLIPLAAAETHLPQAPLEGELAWITRQLRLFAEVLEERLWLGAVIDHADAGWQTAPRPDLRRMLIPVGPAVVFGASNFAFAFSVAGGDTASALVADCPVMHKAYPGHPPWRRGPGRYSPRFSGQAC